MKAIATRTALLPRPDGMRTQRIRRIRRQWRRMMYQPRPLRHGLTDAPTVRRSGLRLVAGVEEVSEGSGVDFRRRSPGRPVFPTFEQRILLEHRAVGEDHDGRFFGVGAGDFGNFSTALF